MIGTNCLMWKICLPCYLRMVVKGTPGKRTIFSLPKGLRSPLNMHPEHSVWQKKIMPRKVYYFTTLNCSRSLLLRYGKIDGAPLRRWKLKSIPKPNTNFQQRKGREGGPFHLPPWRWSETERRRGVQRHLLLPLGIQGHVHLHVHLHRTCYFNVLASRFEFEYCE